MVFPAPIADSEPAAAGDTAWLDGIRRSFQLTDNGVIVLVTEAQPSRLRDLVLALLDLGARDAGLHICTEAPPLLDVPVGATVLLRLRTRDSTWLNYTRPLFAERQWRVVLWDEDGATMDIKATAPDFFDWISHVVECPAGVPRFAVRGLQAAPRFPGVVWPGTEHGLERALEAADPGRARTALSLAVPYADLVATVRQTPGWLLCHELASARDLVRLRWALAESGRTARCVLVEPTVDVPGWWPVSGAVASWEEMLHEIGGDDAATAALVAALLEREPGTGPLAGALRRAGVSLDEIAAELRNVADPGAALACLAHARGLIAAEHVIERRAAPALLRGLDHDAGIEDARARRNAEVHAALVAWRAGAGRADDWSLTETELACWAGTAPAEVPALTTGRPEHWSSVYWLEATLGKGAPSPAALAWARELAHTDVAAYWEQAYGPGQSEPGTPQQDGTDVAPLRSPAPGERMQRMQRDQARRLADLADLLRQRGQHDEAERLGRQALDIVETSLGTEHPDVAATLDVLGRVLSAQGRYNEAANTLRRAVAITDRVLGPAHPAAVARQQALAPLESRVMALSPNPSLAPLDEEHAPPSFGRKDGVSADGLLATLNDGARAAVRTLLLEQSREHYEKILELALRLVTTDPENASWQHDLWVAYNELGNVEMASGNLAAAQARFEAGLEVVKKLTALEPNNTAWQRDLSISLNELGDVEMATGNLSAARARFGDALEVRKKLAALDPRNAQWQRDLSVSYDRLGHVELVAGNLDAARARFDASLEVAKTLVALAPGNAEWQRDLSASFNRLGDLELTAGNLDAARARFGEDLEVAKKLAALDPRNTQWQGDLSVSYESLGDVEMAARNLDAARARFGDALEVRKQLAELDPQNAQWQRELSVAYSKLGDVELAAGNFGAARALFNEDLAVAKKLAALDPRNAEWQRDLSVSYDRLGHVELAAGNIDAARALFDEDLAVAKKLAALDPRNAEWQRDLIAAEMKLAIVDAAEQKTAESRHHMNVAKDVLARLDAAGLLRGDALLEQYRQVILDIERKLPP